MNRARLLTGLIGSGLLWVGSAPAWGQTQTFVDLQGGLGYSSNPLLQVGPSRSSGFGRVSAYGYHGRRTERSETSLSAYLENTTYFRGGYGNQQLFDLNAAASKRTSETVQLFGSLGFSVDFGGQLGSRFYGPPLAELPSNPAIPPSSEIVIDPDLSALSRRQYRVRGQGGATFVLSERDFLSTAFGAQRVFFGGGNSDELAYNLYNGTASWQRRLNELSTVGARFIADYSDYRGGRSIFSYGPQITGSTRLAEALQLTAAIGIVRTEQGLGTFGGKNGSFDLAADASLCRTLQYDQFCASVARRTQSSIVGAATASSTLNASYSRQLSARDQVQLSLGLARTDGVREIGLGPQTYLTAGGSYDRQFGQRLSAGVSVTGRKLSLNGPDPKADVGGTVFIRSRLGSLR